MKIAVQEEDFSIEAETRALCARSANAGAVVTFSGLVRELDEDARVESLHLEHYPGMTEQSLRDLADEAARRWPILDATIIHRVGELGPGEQIVLAAVSSRHRHAAFSACAFIMDFLKTQAIFWKKSRVERDGERKEEWIAAREADQDARRQWGIDKDERT